MQHYSNRGADVAPVSFSFSLSVPTRINVHAAADCKSIYLSAYCDPVEPVLNALHRNIEQSGGMSVSHSVEVGSQCPQIFIGAQVPDLTSTDLWQMRTIVRQAGGMVETARINYHISRSTALSSQQPQPCVGCRHYFGRQFGGIQLVCAMHPYGPTLNQCPDWLETDSCFDNNPKISNVTQRIVSGFVASAIDG